MLHQHPVHNVPSKTVTPSFRLSDALAVLPALYAMVFERKFCPPSSTVAASFPHWDPCEVRRWRGRSLLNTQCRTDRASARRREPYNAVVDSHRQETHQTLLNAIRTTVRDARFKTFA